MSSPLRKSPNRSSAGSEFRLNDLAWSASDTVLGVRYYVAADRSRAEKMLKKAVDLGMHSIWLTVDAPVVSLSGVASRGDF